MVTRLVWLARDIWLEIIATMICDNPVCKSSACTTKAGRVLAVRRLELGNSTSTTSPRLQSGAGVVIIVVNVHFWRVPIFKCGER